ncbi:MAG: response regulator transcription factor [Desulfobacteraceae bacterium]|nr:response regulator transcription factor [Desulfobacteraceae bacterium]
MRAQYTDPILIVEDDPNTASLVATYLQREGFSTVMAHDGREALKRAQQTPPLLVILDVMLPKVDGWEICKQLRNRSDVPILMLTAREEEIDRVLGLTLGADDYVVKPFSPRELVERVKAILRRARPTPKQDMQRLSHGEIEMDLEKHTVTVGGHAVTLTVSEYKLLRALMRSPGRVFSREVLLHEFYDHGEIVVDRVIDVHIGKLRQKIEADPARPKYILTVRGFGYRLAEKTES